MIGMFVANMVSRWWSMRSCICQLLSVVHNLMTRLCVRMKAEDRKYKERMLRLCLLSHALVYDQARKKRDRDALQYHVDAGLMSPSELCALDGKDNKPLVVWSWIACYF